MEASGGVGGGARKEATPQRRRVSVSVSSDMSSLTPRLGVPGCSGSPDTVPRLGLRSRGEDSSSGAAPLCAEVGSESASSASEPRGEERVAAMERASHDMAPERACVREREPRVGTWVGRSGHVSGWKRENLLRYRVPSEK